MTLIVLTEVTYMVVCWRLLIKLKVIHMKKKRNVLQMQDVYGVHFQQDRQTWAIMEERLEPYLEKNRCIMVKYTKHINEIMSKMSPEEFADNTKLSPMYLIGFHHYNALLWNENKTDNNAEEE